MTIQDLKPELKLLIDESRRKKGNDNKVNIDVIIEEIKERTQYKKFKSNFDQDWYVVRSMMAMIISYRRNGEMTHARDVIHCKSV